MEGGTNGQSASGAAAWSCLVRSFRRAGRPITRHVR